MEKLKQKFFPTLGNFYVDELANLNNYSQATTITLEAATKVLLKYNSSANITGKNKKVY